MVSFEKKFEDRSRHPPSPTARPADFLQRHHPSSNEKAGQGFVKTAEQSIQTQSTQNTRAASWHHSISSLAASHSGACACACLPAQPARQCLPAQAIPCQQAGAGHAGRDIQLPALGGLAAGAEEYEDDKDGMDCFASAAVAVAVGLNSLPRRLFLIHSPLALSFSCIGLVAECKT